MSWSDSLGMEISGHLIGTVHEYNVNGVEYRRYADVPTTTVDWCRIHPIHGEDADVIPAGSVRCVQLETVHILTTGGLGL